MVFLIARMDLLNKRAVSKAISISAHVTAFAFCMALALPSTGLTQKVPAKAAASSERFLYNQYPELNGPERERLEREANDRFFYMTDVQKDGAVILYHNSRKPAECKGDLLAERVRVVMGKREVLQSLCWRRDKDAAAAVVIDPKALFFKTQTIPAKSLRYIKSESEERVDARFQATLSQLEAARDAEWRAAEQRQRDIHCTVVLPNITCE